MYCDTIHFFVLEDVLCPCEKSLFWLWCVVWFGPDEGTRDGTIWERTSDRRRRKKRLRQNMWAINTHLSRKTEQWWKWRAERLTGTGRLRVKVKMIERQVRGGGAGLHREDERMKSGQLRWNKRPQKRQRDISLSNPCWWFTLGTTSLHPRR